MFKLKWNHELQASGFTAKFWTFYGIISMVYKSLLKTESLDNTILAFWLAYLLWYMSYYTMLSIYGRCTLQFKIGS